MIPCNTGESYCGKSLCDSGASINLMPKSIFMLLGIGEVRPTIVTLKLANRSLTYPEGKIEDVLVRVDKFIFPTDFIILDFEANKKVPIILGRPFLSMGRTLIDLQKDKLTIRVQDDKVTFNILKVMKFPDSIEECLVIEELETLVSMESNSEEDPLENALGSELFEDEKGNEGLALMEANSSWVCLVQRVPKKGEIMIVENERNELIPMRTITGWRTCIDYRKLNKATRKEHFALPFIDQTLDRLGGNEFYYFLDGYSGYNQIVVASEDQHKTTFTYPYSTFSFSPMPFNFCNAPATFQRCMMAIFIAMVENYVEVFVDDSSVFGNIYDVYFNNLAKALKKIGRD
ncbi:RNA-directed DNA polymerase-like protein [Gossypium australe]|uniref:RNA-directed DNA polymerase-like protein n=1 Tax=Gossypium australe TaxID=47621 RepID=A0A5B6WQA5_9ROSI|nr:RNA-directed DNA polymerase-like protein [Gossypium australe]